MRWCLPQSDNYMFWWIFQINFSCAYLRVLVGNPPDYLCHISWWTTRLCCLASTSWFWTPMQWGGCEFWNMLSGFIFWSYYWGDHLKFCLYHNHRVVRPIYIPWLMQLGTYLFGQCICVLFICSCKYDIG